MISVSIPFSSPLVFLPPSSYNHKTLPLRERIHNKVEQYFCLGDRSLVAVQLPCDHKKRFERLVTFSLFFSSSSTLITACKIISYFTIVIPLLMLLTKFLLRYPYRFSAIAPCPESPMPSIPSPTPYQDRLEMPLLQNTQPLSPHFNNEEFIKSCLEKVLPTISEHKENSHHQIKYLTKNKYICFELPKQLPGMVFKTFLFGVQQLSYKSTQLINDEGKKSTERYENTKKIALCIKTQKYDLLRVPKSKLISIPTPKGCLKVIAEEKLPLYPDLDTPLVWKIKKKELQSAFKQLAMLIHRTGLQDIKPNNCSPFLNDKGLWSLALLDAEFLDYIPSIYSAPLGLLELINSMHSKENMDTVKNILPREYLPDIKETMRDRLDFLSEISAHEQAHINKGNDPYAPLKPIILNDDDINDLGLNLNEQIILDNNTCMTLKEFLLTVVQEINCSIKEEKYRDREHYIVLENPNMLSMSPSKDNQQLDHLWTRQILNALQAKKHICFWKDYYENAPSIYNHLSVWV